MLFSYVGPLLVEIRRDRERDFGPRDVGRHGMKREWRDRWIPSPQCALLIYFLFFSRANCEPFPTQSGTEDWAKTKKCSTRNISARWYRTGDHPPSAARETSSMCLQEVLLSFTCRNCMLLLKPRVCVCVCAASFPLRPSGMGSYTPAPSSPLREAPSGDMPRSRSDLGPYEVWSSLSLSLSICPWALLIVL
jgi:hypothetical protein